MEFAKYVNEYLHDYIRFADAKAGVVFLITGAMFGYLVKEVGPPSLGEVVGVKTVLFGLAVVSDLCAMGLGLWIVYPRLSGNSGNGVIFWEHIRKFKKEKEYASAMADMTDPQRAEALALHNYALAEIAHDKYDLLQLAIWSVGIGAFFTSVLVILY